MPVTEGPITNERTALVRALFEWVKDSEEAQAPYREAHERSIADAAKKATRREFMRRISRQKKGMRFPGSRPWQKAGFKSRQAWLDHIDAQAPLQAQTETEMEA